MDRNRQGILLRAEDCLLRRMQRGSSVSCKTYNRNQRNCSISVCRDDYLLDRIDLPSDFIYVSRNGDILLTELQQPVRERRVRLGFDKTNSLGSVSGNKSGHILHKPLVPMQSNAFTALYHSQTPSLRRWVRLAPSCISQ